MSGATPFWVYFGAGLAAGMAIPLVLIMHVLMPRRVLDTYWKEPHFRPGELALFTGTIYAPMRTIMLITAIAFPKLGKKRKITSADTLVPRWYKWAAQCISFWVLGWTAAVMLMTVVGYIYFYAIGDPVSLFRRGGA